MLFQLEELQCFFEEVVARPESERASFLATLECREELRVAVLRLLHFDKVSTEEGFLEATARPCDDGQDHLLGLRIGVYRIKSLIGKGGMGRVYLGEREGDVRQRVAIKVMTRGLDSEGMLRRFQEEQQVLANLNHPNIARFLDAGRMDDGRPYLIIEYVEGQCLTRFATGSLEDRVRLLLKACDAVEHAHDRGVIHRDLKPGNILVTSHGDVRVLDFGLARRLVADESLDLTRTGVIVGTPGYMAPEQADCQGAASVATDLYGLGAVLYELLTDRPPFKAGNAFETLRQVREQEPLAPRRLNTSVPVDLETICLKCLEKNPSQRYRDVRGLAEDIQRFLDGSPVLARPIGNIQRGYRWAKKRPLLASLVLTLVVLLVGSSITFLYLWQLAERRGAAAIRRHEMAMDALDLYTKSAKLRIGMPAPVTNAEKEDLIRALDQYDRLLSETSADGTVKARTARAHREITWIFYHLGDLERAARQGRQAIALIEDLKGEFPNEAEYSLELSRSHLMLANICSRLGQRQLMAEQAALAVSETEFTIDKFGDNEERAGALACHQYTLACCHLGDRATEAAEPLLRAAREIEEKLANKHPEDSQRIARLASVIRAQGECAYFAGRELETIQMGEQLLLLSLDLSKRFPDDPLILAELLNHRSLAFLQRKNGNEKRAVEVLEKGLELSQQMAKRFPRVSEYRWNEIKTAEALGYFFWKRDQARATGYFQIAADSHKAFAASSNREPLTCCEFCFFLATCPDLKTRDVDQAAKHCSALLVDFPSSTDAQLAQAIIACQRGDFQATIKGIDENLKNVSQGRYLSRRLVEPFHAIALAKTGKVEEARLLVETAKRELLTDPPVFVECFLLCEVAEGIVLGQSPVPREEGGKRAREAR